MNRIPQGIEVLVRKASVDPAFRALLLEQRAAAAGQIGLALDPAEAMMLAAVPAAQLEAIIARTDVPQEHRRAFLGQAAAAMVAALGAMAGGACLAGVQSPPTKGIRPDPPLVAPTGIRPDPPPVSRGIRPDVPPPQPPQPWVDTSPDAVEQRVVAIVASQLKVAKDRVSSKTSLVKDLNARPVQLIAIRKNLEQEYRVEIPSHKFGKLHTVGQVSAYVRTELVKRQSQGVQKRVVQPPMLDGCGGIRPDRPAPLINRPDPVQEAEQLRRKYRP